MDIAPDKQNIDRVFSNITYHIDFYQRDYKWTSEPVLRLLDDVFFMFNQEYEKYNSLEPSTETVMAKYSWYYLNTYVTNVVDGKVYVVDGQQRLTSLTLLLIKLYNKAKEHECDSDFVDWINSKITGFSGGKRSYWMNHEKSLGVLKDLFENKKEHKEIDTSSSITSVNLVANYGTISKYIDSQLEDKHKFETFVYFFLYRLVLINLTVEQTEVPMVFEVINDRGVRLKPYEILKGKLLGQIDKIELDKFNYNHVWESKVKEINDFKEDEIDTFFRYYLKAKYSNSRKEGTLFDGEYHREMFTNSMNEILELNHNSAAVKNFLDTTFSYYSALYIKILKAYKTQSEKYPSVFINKLNEMDGQFLLILSACKLNDPKEDEKIEKIAYEIDRLFALLQLQNSYDSNAFYELLYKISEEVRNGELDAIRGVFDKHLFTELEKRRNSAVTEGLQYAFFRNTGINLNMRFKRYYFARIEQFFSANLNLGMKHPIEDLVSKTGAKTGFHIEHILSHNEENKAFFNNDDDLFEQERNRLGGILLLKGRDNISSNNEPYAEKLKTYANTLYWNETLREDAYKSKLDMKDLKSKYGLDLRAMNKFGKEELEMRQRLLFAISKYIWN
ncbi:DUF262 domain-containing protein [Carboxylicivirga caseinilyticus]|uniref:DUF262 domain-containing protein n=1 Tax=Carboxylicivirga caseinilyticus TaxID=3417572 RepID=UPI003D32EA7A|nr:DUF262 domain-containing protein [Marinilabiliaceae bacterium A049]